MCHDRHVIFMYEMYVMRYIEYAVIISSLV